MRWTGHTRGDSKGHVSPVLSRINGLANGRTSVLCPEHDAAAAAEYVLALPVLEAPLCARGRPHAGAATRGRAHLLEHLGALGPDDLWDPSFEQWHAHNATAKPKQGALLSHSRGAAEKRATYGRAGETHTREGHTHTLVSIVESLFFRTPQ